MGRFKSVEYIMELGREISALHASLQTELDEGDRQKALNAEHKLRSALYELRAGLGGDDEC